MEDKRKIKFILYAFAILLLTGVVGYMIILKINFIDAFYMTVITISTVGFGEVAKMDAEAKIFSIFMIFWGLGIVGYTFSTIVVLFVEGRIISIWKGKKMEKQIKSLNNHYIVCGSGEIADVIINKFSHEGLDFVVITDNESSLEEFAERGILEIQGSPTEEAILDQAGIQRAKGLICVLDSEVDNIVTVLTARNLNKELYIIANSLTPSGSDKLLKVGANKTLSANEISGKRMAAMMIKPNVISFLDVFTRAGDIELGLEEVTVMKDSYLENKALKEAAIPKMTGLIVIAIRQIENGRLLFNPPVDYVFTLGDVLLVLGREDQVDKLRHLGDEVNN